MTEEARKAYAREYREKNKEKIRELNRKWREKNREHYRAYQREYQNKRYNEDEEYRGKMAEYREQNKEKAKVYGKQYYESHKDELNEKARAYHQENIERFREYSKQYYQENKDAIYEYYTKNRDRLLESRRQRYYLNIEESRAKLREQAKKRSKTPEGIEYAKQYRKANKGKIKEYHKNYFLTKNGRCNQLYSSYKSIDKNKGLDTSNIITKQWILENIFNGQKCIYCGDSDWTHLGCDRIDNTKGHTPDNVVCCCGICNVERADRMSVEEFVEYRKTHPRELSPKTPKSFEVEEQNGVKVLKKPAANF